MTPEAAKKSISRHIDRWRDDKSYGQLIFQLDWKDGGIARMSISTKKTEGEFSMK